MPPSTPEASLPGITKQAERLGALIAKARDEELTSSEIVDCLRGIAQMNQSGGRAKVEITTGADAAIYLALYDRHPAYSELTVEDALCAAYDDLQRIIAEESAA